MINILDPAYLKAFNDSRKESSRIFADFLNETLDSLDQIEGVGSKIKDRVREHFEKEMDKHGV